MKRLEVQGSMALGFVDLEKAFDTVPREMVVATLRWMGVPEAEVRMAEGKYEKEGQEGHCCQVFILGLINLVRGSRPYRAGQASRSKP